MISVVRHIKCLAQFDDGQDCPRKDTCARYLTGHFPGTEIVWCLCGPRNDGEYRHYIEVLP